MDIKADPFADVITYHNMLKICIKQQLKAFETTSSKKWLKGAKAMNDKRHEDSQLAVNTRLANHP
eukprot:8492237-Heterocapsa_arctica.AAC.1